MKIVRKSGDFSPVQMFKMLNRKCMKMSKNVGIKFDCTGYVDVDKDENDSTDTKPTLFVKSSTGEIYSSTSNSVRNTFDAMIISFGEPTEEKPIKNIMIIETESKNGRNYLGLDILQ